MPTYSYSCEKCNNDFELFFYIKDYIEQPKCVHCNSKCTYRLYVKDVSTQNTSVRKADSELKTIGDLADRNRDRLSSDEKAYLHHKHNSYREVDTKPLPKGMTRMKKGQKTIWPS
jgi:putative FmdB family regulatory protein